MGAILIQTKDASELKFIKEILRRTKIKNKELNKEDYEDLLLGVAMITEKTGEKVSKETIMDKLSKK